MQVLNMSHNQLSRLEAGWRTAWLGLRTLDLAHNSFTGSLASDSLNFLKHSSEQFHVNLTGNKVSGVRIRASNDPS